MTIQENLRFWDRVSISDGCWIWTGTFFSQGYGAFHADSKLKYAHRVAYGLSHSIELRPDQFLHHTCRNKACVKPAHMEITNQHDHVDSATYGNKDKTHCPHGHEHTPENICWSRGGKSRECRVCKYERNHRRLMRVRREDQFHKRQAEERARLLLLKYEAKDRARAQLLRESSDAAPDTQ